MMRTEDTSGPSIFLTQETSSQVAANLIALRRELGCFSSRQFRLRSIQSMKNRFLFATLLCALAFAPRVHAQHDDDDTTPLGEKMDDLSSAYKKLGKQINDASKNEDSLKLVAKIHDAAEGALKFEPAKKADLPPADQAKFVADFQAKMKSFIGEVDKLAGFLKAGDNAAAVKQLDVLKQLQREGHKEFQKKKQPGAK
jgi:soluble cytochrome b562